MVRLPDIGWSEWIADQQEQFKRSTSGMFDALDFDLGARELESQIPPDYPLLGGPDQWQQVEQQRIKEDLDRQMREEEERRQQQALLEEQQRQQEEAARQQAQEQQALSWAEQLGIPTPSQIGEHLQGLWNRPADNMGTTGAIPEAAPAPGMALTPPEEYNPDVQSFLQSTGGAIRGAVEAVPEGFQRANEAAQEFRESPLGMMGGMPAAMAGVSEISNAFTDPILRGASRGSGIVSQESGSSGIDVDVPIYGRFAPTQEDIVAGVGGAILDPTNVLLEAGPLSRVIGKGEMSAARLAEEGVASAIRRAQGDDLTGMARRAAEQGLDTAGNVVRSLGEEGARQLMGMSPMPTMMPTGGGGLVRRGAEEAGEAVEGALPLAEIPNPYPLTPEERALNAAADARARAAPPHAGYLEEGVDEGLEQARSQLQTLEEQYERMGPNWKQRGPEDYPTRYQVGLAVESARDRVRQLEQGIGGRPAELPTTMPVEPEVKLPPPQQPPPPDAQPAPPRGSAPKTVKIGPELDRAPINTPPVTANEEVMLPDGRVGKVAALMRQGGREQAHDIVTVMLGDGTAIRASARDLERHGVPTTSTSPHPGFSTGESKPLPDGRGGGAGGGGKPPAPPVGGGPTPPAPPPGRPSVGPGSVVDAQHEKLLKKNEDIAHGRIKPGPPDEATLGKLEKWITIARQKLTDRRAPLEALEKYMEGITGQKLSIAQRAHLAARVYEGSADAAKARLERGLKPTYSELSAQDLKEMDAVWEHLDAWDKSEAVRYNVQQEALGKKLSEARPRIDAVRREAEATLEVQRAKRREGAAVKEVMAAEKERTRLLADMERLGIDTERRAPQEPGVRRAKRETQRLETPEISKAHDAWTKNTIRRQTAEARVTDARERIEHEIQWAQEKIEKRRAIGAETRAENVQATRKTPSGIDPHPPETVMDNLRARVGDERFDKIKAALDASFAMRDEMREEMVASGIWTPELAKTLMERFPHYSPTKLLEHMTELDDAAAGGKTFSISGNLIHKLTERGSEGARVSAVESLVDMVYQYQEAAAKNKVMRRVTGWADVPAMQPFVQRLKGDEPAPKGWEAFSSRVDGKIERIAVLSPYSEALKLNSPFQKGAGGRILSGLSTPLRAGATALRPAFIVTNAVNDGIASLLRFTVSAPNPLEAARGVADLYQGYHASFGMAGYGTRAATGAVVGGGLEATREAKEAYETGEGFSPLKIVGAAAAGAGLGLAVRASKADRAAMQRMREAGGSIGERGRWGKDTIPTLVQELRGQNRAVRVARTENDLKSILSGDRLGQLRDAAGLLWSRPLESVGGIVETAPRLAAFRRAERQGLSLEESANAARRITADFSAGGAWTKNVNTLIPFLNATTQGMVEDALAAGWGSKKQAAKFGAAMAVVVPAIIATEIWNRTVAPDDYQDVSRFTQDHGLVMLSPEAPTGEGKRGLLFIPTRGLMGSIVTLTKAALHTYLGDDPRTWQRLAADTGMAAVNHISPVSADGMGILQSMTPPMSGAAFELMANYDSFRNQPIVSRSMQTLPVSEQYDDRTSQLARQLSRTNLPLVGGSSPMKIDWALRAFSPGPGEAVLGVADAAIHLAGSELPTSTTRDVPRGARDVPLVGSVSGRFLRTAGSERQNLAYDQAEEIAARNRPDMLAYLERSPAYQQATPDRQRQMLRSMETTLLEQSRELAGVTSYEKPKSLGVPERYYGVESGSRLETQIAAAFAVTAGKRTPQQQMLVAQYRSLQNPSYPRAARQQRAESTEIRDYIETSTVR